MSFVGALLLWSLMQHAEAARLLRAEPVGVARGQTPVGYVHAWGRSVGMAFTNEGRGVAVTTDGSVIWAGTTLYPGSAAKEEPPVPMTRVSRYPSAGGEPCWSVVFEAGTPLFDMVAARALALADPSVEGPTDGVAYVVGRYRGSVDFSVEESTPPMPATDEWSYVAKVRQTEEGCPASGGRVPWVTEFTGSPNAALAVATGRLSPNRGCGTGDGSIRVFGSVVVGGFFTGTVWFGGEERSATDGEDGYIAILNTDGHVALAFRLGGPGDQRITALAIDERTQDLIVVGAFTDPQTDFRLRSVVVDPPGGVVPPTTYSGGRDMFAARYRITSDPETAPLWLYTFGTAGDDEAAGVALGVNDDEALSTLAFVGGWITSATGGRDLFMAAVQDGGATRWTFSPAASGDDRVLGVSVDGLGRPVFVGQFGCPYAPGTSCEDPSIAFGPTVLGPQGLDAFVARFHPITGEPDWACRLGGEMDEAGTAIAFDPAYTGRLALTGWFGRPDAPPFEPPYSIDLDPGPGTSAVSSAGTADAFVSVHEPESPPNVGFQVSLVLDNSVSMHCEPHAWFGPMLAALRHAISRPEVIPSAGSPRPGGGVRQSAVQINAIVHTTRPLLGREARVLMPWTVIDDATRDLFARKLAASADHAEGGRTNRVADGLLAARDSLSRSGVGSSAYASILLIGNEPGMEDAAAARVAASASGFFDRICSLGAWTALRDTMLQTVIAPVVPDPQGPLDIDQRSTGIAAWAEAIEPPPSLFADLLLRMLTRLAWCPSDYTRDECTDGNGGESDDCLAWNFGFQRQDPYGEWNMDGEFTRAPDSFKFRIDIDRLPPPPNARVCQTCPPN